MNYGAGYTVGAIMGGVVILYLMTRLILLAFRDKKRSTKSIVISACISLGVATILAGYGMADGGSPNFKNSFLGYLVPTLIVIVIEILRVRYLKAKSVSST